MDLQKTVINGNWKSFFGWERTFEVGPTILCYYVSQSIVLMMAEIQRFHLCFSVSNTTTVFGTGRVSETSEAFVIVALAAFLLFANILLMNLLIADFRFEHLCSLFDLHHLFTSSLCIIFLHLCVVLN